MAVIKIKRTSEYNNLWRDYKIYIDGKEVGTIANGKTRDFVTTAGQHTISAKIDWCSSPEFAIDIKENETKILKVGGFKNGEWLITLGIGIFVLYFILNQFIDFGYTIHFGVPLFLFIMYYITI
jgi:hypothetical protein